jgi:diacylglycerol kinase (ATP)
VSVDPLDVRERRTAPPPVPHFVRAAMYSLGGLRRLRRERAFQEEIAFLAVVSALFLLAQAGLAAYLAQIVLFLVLAAVEALNTAVEIIIDRLSPETSDFAEQAKDLGSFAVLCLLCANGGFALLVVLRLVPW